MSRIAYVMNRYPAPSHTFVRREIIGLEGAGWEVHRFSHGWRESELVEPMDCSEAEKTMRLALKPTWTGGRYGREVGRGIVRGVISAARAASLRRIMIKRDLRHVHAHFDTSTDTALLATEKSGRSFSFTVHGPEEFESPHALRKRVSQAAFVACISEHTRGRVAELCPLHADKLHVVRCGIDIAHYEPTPTADTNEMVCVGRLCSRKRQAVLLRLAAKIEGLRLRFVGDGPDMLLLRQLAADLGVVNRVRFAGWACEHDVRRHIRDCRALVLPSSAEGLPVVLMEAFALGRVVIATDVGAINELVPSAMRVTVGDNVALGTLIREVLAAPTSHLDRLADNGLRAVLKLHDASANAATLGRIVAGMQ